MSDTVKKAKDENKVDVAPAAVIKQAAPAVKLDDDAFLVNSMINNGGATSETPKYRL